MGVKCCIPGCNAKYTKKCGIAFHRVSLRNQSLWSQQIHDALQNADNFTLQEGNQICSGHFLKDDYFDLDIYANAVGVRNTLVSEGDPKMFASKFTLKRDAYPSVFGVMERPALKQSIKVEVTDELNDETIICPQLNAKRPNLTPPQEDTEKRAPFKETFTKTTAKDIKLANVRAQLKNTKVTLKRRNIEILRLKSEVDTLKNSASNNPLHKELDKVIAADVECDADGDQTKASFLLDQLSAFFQIKHNWRDSTLREAVKWQATSPDGYEYARTNVLRLPHVTTLRRYVRPVDGEVGVDNLMKERLVTEIQNSIEQFGSFPILIDET